MAYRAIGLNLIRPQFETNFGLFSARFTGCLSVNVQSPWLENSTGEAAFELFTDNKPGDACPSSISIDGAGGWLNLNGANNKHLIRNTDGGSLAAVGNLSGTAWGNGKTIATNMAPGNLIDKGGHRLVGMVTTT